MTRERVRLALLRLGKFLTHPFIATERQPPEKGAGRLRLLLIRPDHLGDVLFLIPALRTLREALPQAHIALMVGPWAAPVVEGIPHWNELIVCEFPGFTRRPKPSPWAPYIILPQLAKQLHSKAFDIALILRPDFWWGALLAYLARIPCRLGYDVPECQPFLTQALPLPAGLHSVELNLRLVEVALGAPMGSVQPGPLEFPLNTQDETWVREYLAGEGIEDEDTLAILQPGSAAPVKLWREGGWVQVGRELAQEGLCLAITGSAEERGLAEKIASRIGPQTLVAAGKTDLGKLAALMRRAVLVVGVDSGPMHLAVAVGTPTIHLYGPADVCLFGPWGDGERHVILTSTMDCIPCKRLDWPPEELEEHPCVKLIPEEEVLAAARNLLRRSLAKHHL